ncbi:MAG TPA: class I SAM-dependent methyltransferase [Gammaproteobacteria bacterium]|nr:class I SAM-dependent methyltransferase [Gammaproteobacteria bacterium]
MLDRAQSHLGKYQRYQRNYVPESRFGFWFLGTHLWERHVIQITLDDLLHLISTPKESYPVVLDAGCGQGRALHLLQSRFRPQRLIGLDAEDKALVRARKQAVKKGLNVELLKGDCAAIALPDKSIDLIFCHQTFHHLVYQERALAELYRLLKPGGLLLFAESTRAYIHTLFIRILFRHPMEAQRSADEYLSMIRAAGFIYEPQNVLLPYRWWSRTTIAGILELCRLRRVPPPGQRQETLVYMVGVKPI